LRQLVKESIFEGLLRMGADKLGDWHGEARVLYLPLKNTHIDGSTVKVFGFNYYSICLIIVGLNFHSASLYGPFHLLLFIDSK
jgi:hypothetical protein